MGEQSQRTSTGEQGQQEDTLELIHKDVTNEKTRLMLIALDYLQLDSVDMVSDWIHDRQNEKDKLFNSDEDPELYEPWLQWVAELHHDNLGAFLVSKKTPQTYLWFIASEATKSNNKKVVLDLINKLDPRSPWKSSEEDNYEEAKNIVPYSWLYNIWRFLVNLDEKKRDEEAWKDIAFGEYSSGDGWTFLHFAAARDDFECAKELLCKAAGNGLVNATTKRNSYTPLHLAAYHGNASIVTALLEIKSTSNAKDSQGRTPLHHASERGCLASVEAFLNHKDTLIVDAVDENGMTPLHLAACRGHTAVVRELLTSGSARPDAQCSDRNLSMIHKLFISRLLQERREVEWPIRFFIHMKAELESCYAANAVLLEPNQLQSEVWCPRKFNALHFAVVYGGEDTVREIVQLYAQKKDVLASLAAAKDSFGLTPVDWAVAKAPEDAGKSNLLVKNGLIFNSKKDGESNSRAINSEKARTHWHQIREAEQERRKLQWAIDVSEAVLTRRWAEARCIMRRGVTDQISIDLAVWVHLEKTISQVLEFERTRTCRQRLIEMMLVQLVSGGAFSESSSMMQRLLKWAIRKEMVDLVQVIVRDTKKAGDLLVSNIVEVKAGSIAAEESPLQAASKIKGQKGQQMVAAIEQQTDVKRLLLEDRQVYVEYSNTILVGAVLVAALAFQGWVQTPQGYAGMPLNSAGKGMLRFARCNSFGFFLAMGAFMAGAVGAMPPKSGEFVKYRDKVIRAACVASLLMAGAVACQVVGFASALVSIQSGGRSNEDMRLSSRFGTIMIFILSAWFLSRLNSVQNVISLLLDALPRTFLHIIMSIFHFWRLFNDSPTFRLYVLSPSYACVFAPLLHSPPCERVKQICCTCAGSISQFSRPLIQSFKSKLHDLRDSVDSWFQKQYDIYEGNQDVERAKAVEQAKEIEQAAVVRSRGPTEGPHSNIAIGISTHKLK